MTLRRMKTYTGGQGYVYQYYFVGKRPAREGEATEYVFDVTSDRKTTFAVSVFVLQEAVRAWSLRHQRPVAEAEQYGAAKMRLFRAFDEVEDMRSAGRRLTVDADSLEQVLSALGVN